MPTTGSFAERAYEAVDDLYRSESRRIPATLIRLLGDFELAEAILACGGLADYYLAHAARADTCRRLGNTAEARATCERALALARLDPERRFLERRLGALQG